MKKIYAVAVIFLIFLFTGCRPETEQASGSNVIDTILSSFSSIEFAEGPVPDSMIEQILLSGIKAPSGLNMQPWKFTVLRDITKVSGLRGNKQGNVVIFVSGSETMPRGITPDFDCALATAYMYLAAQSLGLGARIYLGPVRQINETMRETLEIPEGYRVVSVLHVGYPDPEIDTLSSASPRKSLQEVVNFITGEAN